MTDTLPRTTLAPPLLAALLACSGAAAAADEPAAAPGLAVVHVPGARDSDARARIGNDAAALPAAVTVQTAEDLETINVGRDISNIFRRVPGVVAHSLDQGDTGNGFKMRGFATGGSHGADTAIYVDGVPQNVPSSEAGAGHGPAFLEWLTPGMIAGVDVIKGPVSVRHGDQNRAGAVDIHTVDGPVPGSVAFTAESYGGRRGTLVWSGQAGAFDTVVVADAYRTDSYRRGAWLDRDNLFWKLSHTRGGYRYSVRLNHYRARYEAAGYLRYDRLAAGLVARDAPEENALPAFGDGRRTALAFNAAPADDAGGWRVTAYGEDFERTRAAAAGGAVNNAGTDDRHILGGQVSYDWRPDPRFALLAGADLRQDRGDATRRRYENRRPTGIYLTNLDLDLMTWGLFTQAQWRVADALKLTGGLRADRFDYDIVNRKRPAASTGYRKWVVTPKAGVLWDAAPGIAWFANAAEGFRSPAAQQISPAGAAGPLGAPGNLTNAGLRPSKVRSYDTGVNVARAGWSLNGALFHTTNDDEVTMTAPDVWTTIGSTTRRGWEIDARWRPSAAWALYASYTGLLRARIDNPLPGTGALISVPRHQGKVGIEYATALAGRPLRLNADAYATTGVPYYTGTVPERRTVPTYTRYDLRAQYDIGNVRLALYAILQPQLISEAYYANASGLLVSPQPRRHGGVTVQYLF